MLVKEARDRSPKSPRWSAGRRASPVGDARRLARCLACPDSAGPTDASQASVRLSALRHPSIRVREAKETKPGRKKRAAGTKECCSNECKVETNARRPEAGGATCASPARSPRTAALVGQVQRHELPARAHLLRRRRSMRRAPRAGELAMAAARAEGHACGSLARRGSQGRNPRTPPLPGAKNSPLPGVPGGAPVEFVQLHDGTWRRVDQVALPPPLDPRFPRLVALPWLRRALGADARTDVGGEMKV